MKIPTMDKFTVLIRAPVEQQIVYKHVISTITSL
ncbi:RNA chaperone Hfq [Bacillus sp. XF8]|nr:RNA chaperone Hfq [Bacillus sp. XF8]